MVLLDLLGRRWVLRLLWEFRDRDRMSFNELRTRCGGVSPSVLSQRLRDLLDAQLLKVEETGWYSVTDIGKQLRDPLERLDAWTKRWAKRLETEDR
jgi:DNA-binding HxlR family transcriptional regulator